VFVQSRTSNDEWGYCTRLSFDEMCLGRSWRRPGAERARPPPSDRPSPLAASPRTHRDRAAAVHRRPGGL